jgi:CarD family transcriptional regulator
MQFSVGDKVVHPYHGPGQITGVDYIEFLAGKKRYYVIEITATELTVYLPRSKVDDVGVRPAMARATVRRVLSKLKSRPQRLSADYKQRQEEVWERLRTGHVMQLVEVVRDLTWHEKRDHLTKRDSEFLRQATHRLAAEMALVSGAEISDMERIIDETLVASMSNTLERDRRN